MFQQILRQKRLSRMGSAGNQNNHGYYPLRPIFIPVLPLSDKIFIFSHRILFPDQIPKYLIPIKRAFRKSRNFFNRFTKAYAESR